MIPNLLALRNYALLPNPSASLSASVLLLCNARTLVIFDAYPKAKYHFLVLPRFPFSLASSSSNQPSPPFILAEETSSDVRLSQLDDLRSLLRASPDIKQGVLDSLGETAEEVVEMIKDEMNKTEGFEWGVNIGFHTIPSMKHLHLHVISDDLVSPSIKTKKHVNSFRPDLDFFIPFKQVQEWAQLPEGNMGGYAQKLDIGEALLQSPLQCHRCGKGFDNMPRLKAHLDQEFEEMKRSHQQKRDKKR